MDYESKIELRMEASDIVIKLNEMASCMSECKAYALADSDIGNAFMFGVIARLEEVKKELDVELAEFISKSENINNE